MKCQRCEGFMLEDDFLDMQKSFEGMWLRAWRCVNCGHAVDTVMAANRQRHAFLQLQQEETVQETFVDATTPLAA
jgi:hypothetical protein